MHYAILEDWVDKGRTETLPEEMVTYLEQLTMVNQLWNACQTPNKIIQKLMASYPGLNAKTARSRWEDACTWFYLDDQVKKDAWRNMLFEKQLKLADAIITGAQKNEDYDLASKVLERAAKVKRLDQKEEEVIPQEAFTKRIKIFDSDTLQFEDLPPPANRKLLAEYIDKVNIEELQKVKLKQDAGIEPKELFNHEAFKKNKPEG
ncbi:hypothetical protein L0P88_03995 [Muricauda sp. SCSIO 64092]|uniref:hypothetical protein n=1 Tax=Allomuricauda sp. SCSIO 64092 TaxID=2908842 RepID=UPI001FF3B30D|nr:hypothetical protein [Muricauda sp. SCSIO 64092]UOY07716.1 hypothetical protein L0P88_03995 [Muricauda sp. SCSIO 64092]